MHAALPIWILAVTLVVIAIARITAPKPLYAPAPGGGLLPQPPASLAGGGRTDIVSFVKQQHEEIKALFQRTLASNGAQRAAAFLALRQLLATHEALEEEVVHPAAAQALGQSGAKIVLDREFEERAAATIITELESLPIDSRQFEMNLRKLQHDVVLHATHEERLELTALERGAASIEWGELRSAAASAYADASSRGARAEIGLFVTMLNRARDILGANASREHAPDAPSQLGARRLASH